MAQKKLIHLLPIDTRVRLSDAALCAYIRKNAARGERDLNQQIVYMLKFAAAQMTAGDLEPIKPANTGKGLY